MGIQAAYIGIDEATLDRLVDLDPGDLAEALEELEEGGAPTTYLDKLWDGLHFVLTGRSTDSPVEGDLLSEAVVGVHVFESEEYLGCTELTELPAIIEALAAVDIGARLAQVDFSVLGEAGVYPFIWDEDPARLREDLTAAFADLVAAHQGAAAAGQHLLVSIV
ncbi:hypothetical protein ASE01_11385 [Nocardioides sp. Root190]|uniref:DUF1877 family protein n=1 Tax=Nocardioides sp. Root190 TaxID=1736488 RepID=UPI0006F4493D|nr:DUF1877 family protein [Nocardioides sp. Root190]KRB77325.1 hypothetical protein ASE01_11385 [Nocardioides sp. Root190]